MSMDKYHLSSAPMPELQLVRAFDWNSEGVSLIAGMEYETEQWNGKWNGTVNIHSCS